MEHDHRTPPRNPRPPLEDRDRERHQLDAWQDQERAYLFRVAVGLAE